MKKNKSLQYIKPLLLVLMACFISGVVFAQEDQVAAQDSIVQDSIVAEKPAKEKKIKQKRDAFKVYGGLSFSDLNVTSDLYQSNTQTGFKFGGSYQRGRFFYFEVGAEYNHSVYEFTTNLGQVPSAYIDNSFAIGAIDVPIRGGINFTSFVSRLVGVRAFIGAVPAFNISIDDQLSKDDINTFNFYGTGGLSVDVAFVFLEAGYNYGFMDLIKNDFQSNPQQFFVNLGLRF